VKKFFISLIVIALTVAMILGGRKILLEKKRRDKKFKTSFKKRY